MKLKKLLSVILALTLISGVVELTAYGDEGIAEPTESETIVQKSNDSYEITDENEKNTLEGCGWLLRSDGTLIVGGSYWYFNWTASKGAVCEASEPTEEGGKTNAEAVKTIILGYQFEKDGETITRGGRYIYEGAFKDCINAEKIIGIEKARQIDEGAFENCTSIESIEFDDQVKIGSRAFAGCSKLKSVTITQLPVTNELSEDSELLYPDPAEDVPAPYKLLPFAEDAFENTSNLLVINVPGEDFEQLKTRMPTYADRFRTDDASKRLSLSVNGVVLTENKLTVQCGSGTATFDPKSYTLTLENATLTDSKKLEKTDSGRLNVLLKRSASIYCGMRELKVVLKGKNIVGKYMEGDELQSELEGEYSSYYDNDFIRAAGSLIITGNGTIETTLIGPSEKEGEYTVYDKTYDTHVYSERSLTFSKVNLKNIEGYPYLDYNSNGSGSVNIIESTIKNGEFTAPDGLTVTDSTLIKTKIECHNGKASIENSALENTALSNYIAVVGVDISADLTLKDVKLKSSQLRMNGSINGVNVNSNYSSEDNTKDSYGNRLARRELSDINRIFGSTVTLRGENDLRYTTIYTENDLSLAGTRLEDSAITSHGSTSMDSCNFYGTDITSYGMLTMKGCGADALYNEQNSYIYAYNGNAKFEDCTITSRKQNSKGERTVDSPYGGGVETFEYTKFSGVTMIAYYSNDDPEAVRPSTFNMEFKNSSISMDRLILDKSSKLTIDNSTFELNNSVLTEDYDYENNIKLVGDIDIMIGSWNNFDYGIFINKFDEYYTFDESTGTLTINNDYGYDAWNQIATEWKDGKTRPITDVTDKVKKVVISDRISDYRSPDFPGYRNLKEIDYGNSVISAGSLEGCSALEKVTLGSNTEWFPDFSDCPKLNTLIINSDKIMANAGERLELEKVDVNINIVVPKELESKYKSRIIPQYRNSINRDGSKTKYPVTVNGEMFTSDKLSIKCGDGTATFDPKTNTVTLENATITRCVPVTINGKPTVRDLGKIKSRLDDTTIVLKGTNVIKWSDSFNGYDNCEIDTTGDLTIKGNGTLLMENNVFIYGEGKYQYDDCDARIGSTGDIVFEGATVKSIFPKGKDDYFDKYDYISVTTVSHYYEISDIAQPRKTPDYSITVVDSTLERVGVHAEYDDTSVSNSTIDGQYYEKDSSVTVEPKTPDNLVLSYGDVDKDGSITANDALMILRQSVGLASFDSMLKKLGDVDNDGSITANDALAVLRKSVGYEEGKVGKAIG